MSKQKDRKATEPPIVEDNEQELDAAHHDELVKRVKAREASPDQTKDAIRINRYGRFEEVR